MNLQLIRAPLTKHRSIAPRLRVIDDHGFLKELEAIDLVDGAGGGVDAVEDDKRLPLRLQVRLRDDLDDRAVFREDLVEGFLELVDFDAFFEVADLVAAWVSCDGLGGLGWWSAYIDSDRDGRLAG